MVQRCLFWSLVFLVLVGSRPTLADPITFTGNVQQDFSAANTMGNLNSSPVTVMNSPLDLGEASFIPANGWVSGWAVNNIQMSYNSSNDTMYVGLAGFQNASGQYAIFGDADGNGNPAPLRRRWPPWAASTAPIWAAKRRSPLRSPHPTTRPTPLFPAHRP